MKVKKYYTKILITILLLITTLFLFREYLDYGLYFDEIFRINNVIPIINNEAQPYDQSIFKLNILGTTIPLMYKEYVSSLSTLIYTPIAFFENYFIGIRVLEFLYFYLTILVLFFIISKYNFKIAVATSLLAATSPLLYPEIRFKLVTITHLIPVSISIHLLYLYFKKNKKLIYLFIGTLLLFLSANLWFYTTWLIAAGFTATTFFYPKYVITFLKSPKKILTATTAASLGIINYIIYNFAKGFPTINKLYNKLFDIDSYNKNPIDYKQGKPLIEELGSKINIIINSFLGEAKIIYLTVIILSIILLTISAYKLIQAKKIKEFKLYFFVPLCFLLTLIFILISPNTTRTGHYTYLIPLFELSMILSITLFTKIFYKTKPAKLAFLIIPILLIANIYTSNNKVVHANKTNGTGFFSPAIFDLDKYIHNEKIESFSVIHLEWGMYAQLYFLNKGEYRINALVFDLNNQKTSEATEKYFQKFFSKDQFENISKYYFPIYASTIIKMEDINIHIQNKINLIAVKKFFDFLKTHNVNLNLEKTLYEKNGEEIIKIYSIDNTNKQFLNKIKG